MRALACKFGPQLFVSYSTIFLSQFLVVWRRNVKISTWVHSEQRINIGIARSRTLDQSSEFEPFLTTFSAPLARVQSNQDIPDQALPRLLQHYESSPIH